MLEPAFTELVESGDQGVYVGGAAGLVEELRADDITTFRGLLETLERRAVLLDLLRSALEAKRPFVRVGSEFADPAFASRARWSKRRRTPSKPSASAARRRTTSRLWPCS